VVAGFRPEHFEVGATSESGATVSGLAEVVEYLGNEELLHVNVSGKDVVAIVDSQHRLKPGDVLTLRLPLDKVYLFDQETGLALDAQRQMAAA
jgi:multiple sugar transport system ATP-binding protein